MLKRWLRLLNNSQKLRERYLKGWLCIHLTIKVQKAVVFWRLKLILIFLFTFCHSATPSLEEKETIFKSMQTTNITSNELEKFCISYLYLLQFRNFQILNLGSYIRNTEYALCGIFWNMIEYLNYIQYIDCKFYEELFTRNKLSISSKHFSSKKLMLQSLESVQ